ncbi:MAG: hypothetical protein AAF936_08635 [Pseudomonadota bacterium]
MGGETSISVANKTFDQIYEDLKPQLDDMSGKTCYARYDAQKGLRIKKGIDNHLPLNRITDKRGQKFADAANVFKQAINYQYPECMIDDLPLGEALVQRVMSGGPDGERISTSQIKALYEGLQDHVNKNGLKPATPDPAVQNTVAASRLVQNDASIEAGRKLLKDAIVADLETVRQYRQDPDKTAAIAERILQGVPAHEGLTKASCAAVMNALDRTMPSGANKLATLHLSELVRMRDKILTANRQFQRLKKDLTEIAKLLEPDARADLDAAISERREIMQTLQGLSFPGGLNDPDQVRKLADDLEENFIKLQRASAPINRPGLPLEHCFEQEMETLGLAMALRSFMGGVESDVNIESLPEILRYSRQVLNGANVRVPNTLWSAPTRQAGDTLEQAARRYNASLQESQMLWRDHFNGDPEATLDDIEVQLSMTLIFNDAMLDSFERLKSIRGDNAFDKATVRDSLSPARRQRTQLNLQLACVRALRQKAEQEETQRAEDWTTLSELSSPGVNLGITPPDTPRVDNRSDAGVGDDSFESDSWELVERFVILGDSDDFSLTKTARAGRQQNSDEMAIRTQRKDNQDTAKDDGRAKILDILNTGPSSGFDSLRDLDDEDMDIQSEPASPRQSSKPGMPGRRGGATMKNPNDESMTVRSRSGSARAPSPSASQGAGGAFGLEDPPLSIQSVSPSPQLNAQTEFEAPKDSDGEEIDLYDGVSDAGDEKLSDNKASPSAGADNDDSVDLP